MEAGIQASVSINTEALWACKEPELKATKEEATWEVQTHILMSQDCALSSRLVPTDQGMLDVYDILGMYTIRCGFLGLFY